jgi:hypothetical protein
VAAVVAGVLVAVPAGATSLHDGGSGDRGVAARRGGSGWSAPAALSPCPAQGGARALFPSDSPTHGTGAGAIVFSASASCPGGPGARVSALGPAGKPTAPQAPRDASGQQIAPRGVLLASGAPWGWILIAGSRPAVPSDELVIQGPAAGPFSVLHQAPGTPTAIARGYLGDVALASASPAQAMSVQLERFYKTSLAAPVRTAPAGSSAPGSPTLALDYRTDLLAVWPAHGVLYARFLPTHHPPAAVQRLAPVSPGAHVTALLSDDGRAIVAWSERRAGEQSVYIDISGAGVRFSAPRLVDRFAVPDALQDPGASPLLTRLSSEGVVMAWAGADAGRWSVRVAPVELTGVRPATTIAPAGRNALLADIAPGPQGEVLALWGEPEAGAAGVPDPGRTALYAAPGFQAYPERISFGEAEQLAGPGPAADASVAIDPDSDRALALWRGAQGRIDYSIRVP